MNLVVWPDSARDAWIAKERGEIEGRSGEWFAPAARIASDQQFLVAVAADQSEAAWLRGWLSELPGLSATRREWNAKVRSIAARDKPSAEHLKTWQDESLCDRLSDLVGLVFGKGTIEPIDLLTKADRAKKKRALVSALRAVGSALYDLREVDLECSLLDFVEDEDARDLFLNAVRSTNLRRVVAESLLLLPADISRTFDDSLRWFVDRLIDAAQVPADLMRANAQRPYHRAHRRRKKLGGAVGQLRVSKDSFGKLLTLRRQLAATADTDDLIVDLAIECANESRLAISRAFDKEGEWGPTASLAETLFQPNPSQLGPLHLSLKFGRLCSRVADHLDATLKTDSSAHQPDPRRHLARKLADEYRSQYGCGPEKEVEHLNAAVACIVGLRFPNETTSQKDVINWLRPK